MERYVQLRIGSLAHNQGFQDLLDLLTAESANMTERLLEEREPAAILRQQAETAGFRRAIELARTRVASFGSQNVGPLTPA